MNQYEEMLLAKNEISNHMTAIMGSMKLSEMQMMFVMDSVLSDLRCRCLIRNSYDKANNEVLKKESEEKKKNEKTA